MMVETIRQGPRIVWKLGWGVENSASKGAVGVENSAQKWWYCVRIRDATCSKMRNQNQTDTNEITTTETKYQTDFYSAEKYQ